MNFGRKHIAFFGGKENAKVSIFGSFIERHEVTGGSTSIRQ
jgi:hypothetical protein